MHSTFERRLGTGSKAVAFGFFVVLALTFLAFVGNAKAAIESAPPPQIWSDKADYAPGETVVLSGANWAPGESVHIRVNDDAGATWSRDVDVIADSAGTISDQFNLPEWFVAVYTVTATAGSGTATTSFTDGTVAVRHASTVQSGLTASYKLERYDGASCLGSVKATNTFPIPGSGSKSIASGGSESVKVTLVGVTSGNYTLDHWNFVDGNDGSDGSPYQVGAVTVTATSFCFATQNNTNRTFIPIFKAINSAPTANAQSVSTNEDTAKTITLSGSDADGNTLTFAIVSGPAHGTLGPVGAVTCTGTVPKNCSANVTYTPALNYSGPDSFSFKVNDGTVDSANATVSITVNAVNDAPTCTNGSATTPEDTPKAITLNCVDVEGDSLSYSIVTDPANGDLTGSGASRTYTPDANFNGSDSFTFKANDGSDSNVTTFGLTVMPANDAPTCSDGAETTDEDTPVDLTLSCADVDGDSLTYTIVSDPTHGDLTGSGASLTYTPDANYNDSDSFTFSATDGNADSNVATFSLTVNAVNDAPTCTNGSETTDEDTPVDLTLDCADVDGDSLTYTVETDPAHGDLTGSGASLTYTPDANYNGSDSFTFSATDGNADSNVATFSLTITAVDDPPTAAVDEASVTVDEGDTAANSGTYGDVDGDTVTLSASVGTVTDNGDGTWDWAFATSDGPDESQTVIITASDGTPGDEAEATFGLTVNNVAPSATFNAPADVNEGSDINLSLSAVVDPGTADTHEYRFKCGDGDWSEWGASAGHACPTTDNGTVVVKGQVRDDDGGESAVYSADVSVNNVAPSATFNAPADVNEGSDINLSLSAVVDPGTADTHEYRFKCGDGDWSEWGASAGHACPTTDNGTVVVKGQVRDDDGGESAVYSADVSVNNVAPSATFNAPADVNEGSDINLSLSAVVDPGTADTHEYRFKCGDGDWSEWGASAGHACPTTDNGTVVVKGQVRDDDGGESAVYSADVSVNNVAPSATFNAPADVNEGSDINLSLSAVVDPGTADTHEYRFKCGDGDWSEWGASAGHACPTTDNGTVVVKGQVRDDDGGESAVYSADVSVNNVAPTVNLSGPNTADEGDTKTYTFTVTDPGADTFSFVSGPPTNYPTCGDHGVLVGTPTVAGGSFVCRFDDGPNTTNVAIKVKDDDGGISSPDTEQVDIIAVAIANVAPTVTAPANQSSDEGESKSFSLGSFSDPGPDSPWAVDVNWGDGSVHTTFTETATGPVTAQTIAAKSHAYGDNGAYTVTVKVTDKNNDFDSKTFTVNVVNKAPTASNPSFTLDPVSGIATAGFDFSDFGWLDTHGPNLSFFTWSGLGNQMAFVTEENIAPNSTGHAAATRTISPGCYNLTVIGTAKDDDGGTSAVLPIYSNSATSVYGRGFRPPIMDNERNIAKYGNVVPVKVTLTNTCTGATVTNVSLYITLAKGVGDEAIEDTNVIAESVSAADTGSQMRTADGMYIFNLSTKNLSANNDWTIRVRLGSTTGPVLLQAVLYPKK